VRALAAREVVLTAGQAGGSLVDGPTTRVGA
jgi:hypothetical protein